MSDIHSQGANGRDQEERVNNILHLTNSTLSICKRLGVNPVPARPADGKPKRLGRASKNQRALTAKERLLYAEKLALRYTRDIHQLSTFEALLRDNQQLFLHRLGKEREREMERRSGQKFKEHSPPTDAVAQQGAVAPTTGQGTEASLTQPPNGSAGVGAQSNKRAPPQHGRRSSNIIIKSSPLQEEDQSTTVSLERHTAGSRRSKASMLSSNIDKRNTLVMDEGRIRILSKITKPRKGTGLSQSLTQRKCGNSRFTREKKSRETLELKPEVNLMSASSSDDSFFDFNCGSDDENDPSSGAGKEIGDISEGQHEELSKVSRDDVQQKDKVTGDDDNDNNFDDDNCSIKTASSTSSSSSFSSSSTSSSTNSFLMLDIDIAKSRLFHNKALASAVVEENKSKIEDKRKVKSSSKADPKACASTTKVLLSNAGLGDNWVETFASYMTESVETIDLSNNSLISKLGVSKLFNSFKAHLKTLKLSHVDLSRSMQPITNYFANDSTCHLVELNLSGTRLGNLNCDRICDALAQTDRRCRHHLKNLDLSNNGISVVGCKALSRMLEKVKLRRFCLLTFARVTQAF